MEKVGLQKTIKNIFYLMFTTMVTFEGLRVEELKIKFFSMGHNVKNVFQGAKINVTTLTLSSRPKQGAWRGVGQECNSRITFTFPEM